MARALAWSRTNIHAGPATFPGLPGAVSSKAGIRKTDAQAINKSNILI